MKRLVLLAAPLLLAPQLSLAAFNAQPPQDRDPNTIDPPGSQYEDHPEFKAPDQDDALKPSKPKSENEQNGNERRYKYEDYVIQIQEARKPSTVRPAPML